MTSRKPLSFLSSRLNALRTGSPRLAAAGLLIGLSAVCSAKDAPLVAIEIYDSPTGPAYVHISDVTINGKPEVRSCPMCAAAPIDKSEYGKLQKLALGPGGVLERGADGVLRYTMPGGVSTVVVVPGNVKFDRKGGYSASDLADLGQLKANAMGTGEVQPLAKGVSLTFVSAPDTELAEYLRARRAASIPGWSDYLARYPSAAHTADAKAQLVALYVGAGQKALDAYDKTAATDTPAYEQLKAAREASRKAHALAPPKDPLTALDARIDAALNAIATQGRAELDAYQKAVAGHAAGYARLTRAKALAAAILLADANFAPGQQFQGDVNDQDAKLNVAMENAEAAEAVKQHDQALKFIDAFRAFAPEVPRIQAILDAAYNFHLAKAKEFEQTPDWQGAIHEYEKAQAVRPSPELADALKHAQDQLVVTRDKAAAAHALDQSKEFEQAKNYLRAYEVLTELPTAQRALVTDDIERLKPSYIQAVDKFAKTQRQIHPQLVGLADETGIEQAYNYLMDAYDLSQNESFHDRADLMGNDLSKYLLEKAKFYLAKPAGSGAELGWMYLNRALPFKASNLGAVRDAMVAAGAVHGIRSKLSIQVTFRDQTSQRDGAGFTGQLESAIVTGLESSAIPIKVLRASEPTPVEADFQLAGDVLQHHLAQTPVIEAVDSKYVVGTKDELSPAWNEANRVYEQANMEFLTAQAELQGATAKGNKGEIKKASEAAQKAQSKVADAHAKLDTTPKNITTNVLVPYTYTRKTITFNGVVQLQFRISGSLGGGSADLIPVTREEQKQYVVLENVKPEDALGVRPSGSVPDAAEFFGAIEKSSLSALTDEVRRRVDELPKKLFAQAQTAEQNQDTDSAGEMYLRFLEITGDDGSAERKSAQKFLAREFNMETEATKAQ